jgi:hypothetical protein
LPTTHLTWIALGPSLNHSGEKQAINHPINATASLPYTREEVKRNVFWDVMSAGEVKRKATRLHGVTAMINLSFPTKCGININHEMTLYQWDT